MKMHRTWMAGRWMLVTFIVAACGCAEGELDWSGSKQAASKDKPMTKARRPVQKEPAAADAKKQSEPAADDSKSREVDEKVDRYVRSMEPQYDPSYQGNDVSSKIQRQNDPDRAARVRQTAIRSRTEPVPDKSGTTAEKGPSDNSSTGEKNPNVDNGAKQDTPEKEPAVQEPPSASQETASEVAQVDDASDKPNPETPASSDPAMKPPVLSQVTIESSSTPVEAAPAGQESAKPTESAATPQQETPGETAPVNDGSINPSQTEPIQSDPVEPTPETRPAAQNSENPTHPDVPSQVETPRENASSDDSSMQVAQAEPIQSDADETLPSNPPNESTPAMADHNATQATSNESIHQEAPVEEPPDKPKEPKAVEPAHVDAKSPTDPPIPSSIPAANSSNAAPPTSNDAFQKRLQLQEHVVAEKPDDVEEQFKLRMMYLVDRQNEKALAPSPGLDAETQEIMLGQIRAVQAAGLPNSPDPAIWANRQLEALEKLRGLLRSKADLLVPKVELCRAIEGYGRYEPFDPPEFKAGGKNRLLLYIEVDNFKSEKTASGMFRTLLSVRESLMNKNGEELWSAKDDNIEDLARGRRRDFYLTIGPLAIPKSLGPGEYVFKVEVEDVLGGKINSNVVRFKMVS
jgi:hypothetical protein